ncbi:MAG: helix-turn-helix domain-containing protein [Methylophilaceae bacterium]|nr:helix-turn-helix transcriptional regulator [Methyloradius sp.]
MLVPEKNIQTQINRFGSCLLAIRKAHRLSQKAVAITAEMDQSYLAAIEAGRRGAPRDLQLSRLAQALNATQAEKLALLEARALQRIEAELQELKRSCVSCGFLSQTQEPDFSKIQNFISNYLE